MRDGWTETTFGDVFKIVAGKYVAKEEYVEGGEFWIYGSNSIMGKLDRFLVEQSHVVMAAIGAYAGAVRYSKEPSWINNNAMALVPSNEVMAKYLHLWLESEFDLKRVVVGTGQPYVQRPLLLKEIIELPPLPEQKRIVDLISSVDSYIDALQQQLESAKKSRNAVLHEILQAGGADWVEGKVGDISVLRYGYTESANWDPIGPKFLRITDIQDGQVNWDLVPYCKISDADLGLQQLKDGDLVFARTGATTGKSFLVTNPPDSVSASYLIRLRPDQSKVNPYYLSIFFQSENYWQQVMAGTSGSAQGGVNASKLSHLKIQIPPLSRQKMISDLIEEMDIHASKIRDSLNRSQNLRSSMLSDLLSGEHQIPASYDKVIGAA
jgi:type I restriction enzyme S subunit